MRDVKQLIKTLNEEQVKPVLDTDGKVLVIAGAGSGKTRVLTTRIAYLVSELGVNPDEILAITFTNKAAGEMKERLIKILDNIGDMWVSTIHSMCVKILRNNSNKLGYDKFFTIYDDTDKEKVLKRVFDTLGYEKDKYLKSFKNLISIAKNDCLSVEDFAKENPHLRFLNEFKAVYAGYEKELERSNAMDFDDLLCKTYILFKNNPDIAESYAKRFKYVHIDEFQDTNTVQFQIAKILSSYHQNLFVVGDDDQSIYSWRGAKIENILDFDKTFSDAKVYKLERNYRSTKNILEYANRIIVNNTGRRGKELWTDKSNGAIVETFIGDDENVEASFVAMQIKNLLQRGYSYSDFAIFMRLNAISRAFEQEFLKYGIPYKIYGGFRFFERKEIKDVLAYLKIINNFKDDESFLRAVSTPRRGVGEKTLLSIKEFAVSKDLSIFEAIDFALESDISSSAINKLINFRNLINNFKEYVKNNGILKTINYILDSVNFMQQFEEKTEENVSKIYNINELKNTAELFEKENGRFANLSDFLNSITLSSDTDDLNSDNSVTVATIHSAKGLEFKCVFICGLDEGILPINRQDLDANDIEEERRLMYVAVTRAKERLYLTRAFSRYMYGRRDRMIPSRFLGEGATKNTNFQIEGEIAYRKSEQSFRNDDYSCELYQSDNSSGYSSSFAKRIFSSKKADNSNKDYSAFKTGTKVVHPKFGEGMIISEKGEGDRKTVDVAFVGLGIKSLSVKYAPMEIK